MKILGKNFLAILLASLLMVSALPLNAYAAVTDDRTTVGSDDEWDEPGDEPGEDEEPTQPSQPSSQYALSVNGTAFTADKLTIACGSGTATFDPVTNTLTLNNAELSKGTSVSALSEKAYIVSNLPSLHLELIGTSVCEADNWAYQLYASGDLTVTGSGDFRSMREEYVKNEDGEYGYEVVRSYTKVAVFGDLTFDGVSLYRWTTNNYDYPIGGDLILDHATATYCEMQADGNIIIKNSTVQGEQKIGSIGYYDDRGYYHTLEDGIRYNGCSFETSSGITVTDSSVLQSTLESVYRKENVDAVIDNVRFDYVTVGVSGDLTMKNVTATCSDREADPVYSFRECDFYSHGVLDIDNSDLKFSDCWSYSAEKACEVNDTRLEDSKIRTYGDLNMDYCKLYGVNVEVDGSLYFIRGIVGANYEGQNTPIKVHGDKIDLVKCDFRGIAKTDIGYDTVLFPHGPVEVPFSYSTFSGALLYAYRNSEVYETQTINLTDSKLMMDQIKCGEIYTDTECRVNVNDTRLLLCTSTVVEDNCTINGNVQIVTGGWNTSRRSGIFIDYKGDYYTFDEETGELRLNNHYGVLGWWQVSRTYESGKMYIKRELTDKVKKVVVSDKITSADWVDGFREYVNLKEIVFGDKVERIGGGYPNYIFNGCTSLESVTIGNNVKTMPSSITGGGIFCSCEDLKKVVIKSEYLIEDPEDSLAYWFPMKGIDSRYKHRDELKIYVPAAQVAQYKEAMPEYKDQIYALYILGDADQNCMIESIDATYIQRSVSGVSIPFTLNQKTANVDGDKQVSVMDATFIQKHLTEMKTPYNIGLQMD